MVSWPLTPELKRLSAAPEAAEQAIAPARSRAPFSPVRVSVGALIMTGVLAGLGLFADQSPLNAFSGHTAAQRFTPEQLRELGIVIAPTGVVVPTPARNGKSQWARSVTAVAAAPAERSDGEFDPLMADSPQAAKAALARQALLRRPILVLASAQAPVSAPIAPAAKRAAPVASKAALSVSTPLVLKSAQGRAPLVLASARTGLPGRTASAAGVARVIKPVQIASSQGAIENQAMAAQRSLVLQPSQRRRGVVGGASARQGQHNVSTSKAVITQPYFDAVRQALVLPFDGNISDNLRVKRLRDGRVYLDLAGVRLQSTRTLGDRPNLDSVTRWAVANQPKGGVRVVLAVNVTCDPTVTIANQALTIALSPQAEAQAPSRAAATSEATPLARAEGLVPEKASVAGSPPPVKRAAGIKPTFGNKAHARLSVAQFDATSKRLLIPFAGTLRDGAIHLHRLPNGRTYLDIRHAATSFSGTRIAEPRDPALTRWSMAAQGGGRVRVALEPRLPGRVDVRIAPGIIQVCLPKPMLPRVRSRVDAAPSHAADFVQPVSPSLERATEDSALAPFALPDEGVSQ